MKGFAVFCVVLSTIVLIGVALPYLDNRQRDYEQRFVGALNFTEETLEAVLGSAVSVYEPAIAPGSKPGHWTLSGTLVSKDELEGKVRALFVASLQSLCSDPADSACWQTVELAIDGRFARTESLANSAGNPVMEAVANETGEPGETDDQLAAPAAAVLAANEAPGASPSADKGMPALAEGPVQTVAPASAESSPTPGALAEETVSGQELILFIQDALKRLRYKPGPIDGKLGARTAAAIRAYQRDFDLPMDGRPTPELLRHLRSQLGDLWQQSRAPAAEAAPPSG